MIAKKIKHKLPARAEEELARRTTVIVHTDDSLNRMSYYSSCIEKDRAKYVLFYTRNQLNFGKHKLERPESSELALVFCIQATSCARIGNKEFAYQFLTKSREFMIEYFDMVHANFEIAASYVSTAQVLTCFGMLEKASWYLENAKQYLDNCTVFGRKDHLLQIEIRMSVQLLEFNDDIYNLLAFLVPFAKEYDLHSETGVDGLGQRFYQQVDELMLPESVAIGRKHFVSYLCLALKIQNLRRANVPIEDPRYLIFADCITSIAVKRESLISNSFCAVSIVEAAKVHEQLLMSDPTKQVIDNLRHDISSLKVLCERQGLVKIWYGKYVQKLEDIIAKVDSVTSSVTPLQFINVQ
jgi:hypothetical protein